MKTFFAAAVTVLSLGIAGLPAQAGYTCTTNSFGQTSCFGTSNGQPVQSNTTCNSFGQCSTFGQVNGRSFQRNCTTNSFGQTSCY